MTTSEILTAKKFNELCKNIVPAIGVEGKVLCSTEEQGQSKLKDKPGLQLVGIYPNYSFIGELDTYKSSHEMLFFVLVKPKTGSDEDDELEAYEQTQAAILKLKEYLFGESDDLSYCNLFPNLQVDSVMIDPEYNILGGRIGWSLKLVV